MAKNPEYIYRQEQELLGMTPSQTLSHKLWEMGKNENNLQYLRSLSHLDPDQCRVYNTQRAPATLETRMKRSDSEFLLWMGTAAKIALTDLGEDTGIKKGSQEYYDLFSQQERQYQRIGKLLKKEPRSASQVDGKTVIYRHGNGYAGSLWEEMRNVGMGKSITNYVDRLRLQMTIRNVMFQESEYSGLVKAGAIGGELIVIGGALAACAPPPAEVAPAAQSTEEARQAIEDQVNKLLNTQQAETPVPAATVAPKETATPEPIIEVGKGGPFTPEQQAFMESDEGKKQIDWLNDWFRYFASAEEGQRPFFPDQPGNPSSKVFLKPMEDVASPGKYVIVLEAPEGYPNVVFRPPIAAWEKMSPPPKAEQGHNIPEGFGPTKLSLVSGEEHYQAGIPLGSTLVMENGKPVYVAGGQVVGVVEGENWKAKFEVIDQQGIDYRYLSGSAEIVDDRLPQITIDQVLSGQLDASVRWQMSKIAPNINIKPAENYSVIENVRDNNKGLHVSGFYSTYGGKPDLWPRRFVGLYSTKSPFSHNDSYVLVEEVVNSDGSRTYLKYLLEQSKYWKKHLKLLYFGEKRRSVMVPWVSYTEDSMSSISSPDLLKLYTDGWMERGIYPYNQQYDGIDQAIKNGKLPDNLTLKNLFYAGAESF